MSLEGGAEGEAQRVVALDSMDDGRRQQRQLCLQEGRYELRVEEGDEPVEAEWHLCGSHGERRSRTEDRGGGSCCCCCF